MTAVMGWEAWLTVGVVVLCFAVLMFTRAAPDATLVGGLTILLVSGILSPEQALSGMANPGMVTVGVLYVVVSGLRETGAINWIVHNLLGRPASLPGAQLRLMGPVAAMSAFLNNTPVVAMMIPAVHDWAKRFNLSASKLMIPLSYAAIAGGTCTLIGTSTNLVVNGLLIAETSTQGFRIFDLVWIGVPITLTVVLFIVVFSHWVLPRRTPPAVQFADAREYTVEMVVEPHSPLVGKTIESAGLRQLPGLYLVEIDRDGQVLPAVSPFELLHASDRLIFAGVVESVVDLRKIKGLQPATDQVFKIDAPRPERRLIEAVVSDSCALIGKSIREGQFRSVYNAAVIAVARNGEKVKGKIGDIVLRPGDTLLLEAHPSFVARQKNSRDFFLVSELADSAVPRHERALLALGILVAMVVAAAVGWLSMLEAAMVAAGLMIISRCTTAYLARRAVDWQVLVVIAASFGIGHALQSTGAAAAIAGHLMSLAGGDPWTMLALVFFITALFTSLITNNAAAVLMFPIALASSNSMGVDFAPFAVTIMMAASASFATPIGYQTNLMVYGPGGYHFTDYLRVGVPLTVLVGVLVVALVPAIWPF